MQRRAEPWRGATLQARLARLAGLAVALLPGAARAQAPLDPAATAAAAAAVTAATTAATVAGPSASDVIKTILGLVALLALAYLGGHRRVREIERKLRISHVVTAGLPFVVLGFIAHRPGVGVLSDAMLRDISPLLPLGLGWIGFAVGLRFDVRLFQDMPRSDAMAAVLYTAMPIGAIVGGCSLALFFLSGGSMGGSFLRDAIVLGAAGAMAGRAAPRLLAARGSGPVSVDRVRRIVQLEELAAVAGLTVLAAYFRPPGAAVAWQLPGTAWLFVTLGVGTTVAVVTYAMLGNARTGPELTVLLLGSVCFAAGMASFLRLSPVVVCFLAGALLVNLPRRSKESIRDAVKRLERPIYLVFLIIAGALWRPGAWQGWLLLVLFVGARMFGRWLATATLRRTDIDVLQPEERRNLSIAPMDALAIAIIVNAQDLYFGPTVPWMVTAVLGGAIVTEIVVQAWSRAETPAPAAGA